MERDTSEKHEIKSLDLPGIYQFDLAFLPYLLSFQSYVGLKKLSGLYHLTASTGCQFFLAPQLLKIFT